MLNDIGIKIGLEGVAQANKEIKGFESSTNSALGGIGRTFDNAKTSFKSFIGEIPILGNAFSLLSNPIGAAATLIVGLGTTLASFTGTAATFQEQLSTVGALQGLEKTDQAFVQLTDKARELGRTTEFTAKEAADAMEFLSKAGFDASQVIAGTEQTLSLATVGSLELGRAAEVAGDTLSQFKLPVEDLGRVVDVIAKTSVSANTNVEQFAEAMKSLGPAASAFGVSIEESSAAIGILANSGLKGTVATTTLATAFNRLAAPPKAAAEAIEQYGIQAFDAQGQFIGLAPLLEQLETGFDGLTDKQKAAAISTIFGNEAVKQFQILLGTGSDGLRQYTAEIEEASAQGGAFAANIREIKLDNFNGSLKLLNSAWEDFQIALTNNALPALQVFVEGITSAVTAVTAFVEGGFSLGSFFSDNTEVIALASTAILAYNANTIAATVSSLSFSNVQKVIAASVGRSTIATRALAIVQGLYSTASGILAGKISIAAIAQNALNIALKANPIGLIVTVVGLLVTGLIALYKRSETFRAIWSGVTKVFTDSIDTIKNLWQESVIFRNVVGSLFGPIGFLVANFDKVKAVGQGLLNLFKEYAPTSDQVARALYFIVDPLGILGNSFTEAGQTVLRVKDWFIETWQSIIEGFQNAREAVADFFDFDVIGAVADFLSPLQGLNRAVVDIAKSLGASFTSGFNDQLREEGIDAAAEEATKRLSELGGKATIEVETNVEPGTLEVNTEKADEKISTTTKKVETLNSKLSDLGVDLSAIEKLDALESKLGDINSLIAAGPDSNGFEGIFDSFSGLSSIIDNNLSKINELGAGSSESLLSLQENLNSLSGILQTGSPDEFFASISQNASALNTDIDSALDNVNQSIAEAGANLSGLGDVQIQNSPAIQSLADQLGTVDGLVNSANQALSNIGADSDIDPAFIDNFQTSLSGLQGRISDINSNIASIGGDAGPVSIESINSLLTQLEGLNLDIVGVNQNIEGIGVDVDLQSSEALEQLRNSLAILQNQTLDTKAGLANVSASVDPASVAALEELRARLLSLKDNINDVGDSGSFNGLITEAQNLKAEISSVSNRIVSLGDISSLPLGQLEQKFNDIQAAIKLISPESSAFSVLIEQSNTLQVQIDKVKEKIQNLTDGIDPNPIVIPVDFAIPDQAVDLGIVANPVIVPIQIDPGTGLESLRAVADNTGLSFDFLRNNFNNANEALQAMQTPLAQIASGLGASDDKALKIAASFQELKKQVKESIGAAATQAFVGFGQAIGQALVKGEGFGSSMAAVFKGLVSTILVEVPKLIGTFLIQTGVGLGFPAGIPFILGGIALSAISGIGSGLLNKLGGASGGSSQVAPIRPSTVETPQIQAPTPATAAGPSQTSPLGLAQISNASPPVSVSVYIGGEDLTDTMATFFNTERELTG